MSGRASKKRVTFSPDVSGDEHPVLLKRCADPATHKSGAGMWMLGWRKGTKPAEFLRGLRNKAARVVRCMSAGRSLRKVSSSSAAASNLGRSRSLADHPTLPDSHRAEAIEDCIEFLNSSATLRRSTSVSAC